MFQPNSFDFRSYQIQNDGHTVHFVYALDGVEVIENIQFHTVHPLTLTPLVDRLLFGLHLILGISYYKAFCPHTITVSSGSLNQAQAEFWNTVYTKGLGQFFYENKIDFRNLIHFPAHASTAETPIAGNRSERSLLPLGGGKDSLVSSALLTHADIPFDVFVLGDHAALQPQLTALNTSVVSVSRTIDPQLFAWNTQGALNGHIPISAIFSWVSLVVAAVDDYQYIVLSNEASANVGNIDYLGLSVNHQWSKSIEYERMLQEYVHDFITPDITYYSLLRPHSEAVIAQLFARHCTPFFDLFTSCNRNFAITTRATKRWCGTCPKCAFVFALLAGVVTKDQLLQIFGKNLFADAMLLDLYRELLGVKDFKPFECVGTPEEMMYSMNAARSTGAYDTDAVMRMYIDEVLPHAPTQTQLDHTVHTLHPHLIPSHIYSRVYGS